MSQTACAPLASNAATAILLMLGNVVPLWETMLAAMKLGAVVIPATTSAGSPSDLKDRFDRGRTRHLIVDHQCRRNKIRLAWILRSSPALP